MNSWLLTTRVRLSQSNCRSIGARLVQPDLSLTEDNAAIIGHICRRVRGLRITRCDEGLERCSKILVLLVALE